VLAAANSSTRQSRTESASQGWVNATRPGQARAALGRVGPSLPEGDKNYLNLLQPSTGGRCPASLLLLPLLPRTRKA